VRGVPGRTPAVHAPETRRDRSHSWANYKDAPEDAAAWLDRHGDPYTRTGADRDGRVAIDWGVYGVPETFVIDRDGRIAYKHIGPLNERVLEQTVLPLIARLHRGPGGDRDAGRSAQSTPQE
jgi:cytochrome c biogenesis protein CcmG/thiol:disulfide interchange protein DsbE